MQTVTHTYTTYRHTDRQTYIHACFYFIYICMYVFLYIYIYISRIPTPPPRGPWRGGFRGLHNGVSLLTPQSPWCKDPRGPHKGVCLLTARVIGVRAPGPHINVYICYPLVVPRAPHSCISLFLFSVSLSLSNILPLPRSSLPLSPPAAPCARALAAQRCSLPSTPTLAR